MRRRPAVEAGGAFKQLQSLVQRFYDLVAILGGCRRPLLRDCSLALYPGLLGSEHLAVDMTVVMSMQKLLLLALELLEASLVPLGLPTGVGDQSAGISRPCGLSSTGSRVDISLAPKRLISASSQNASYSSRTARDRS